MKSYLRFLSRNKLYTAIEVVGLSVALAFVLVIGTYVWQQYATARGVKDYDRIYSVGLDDLGYPRIGLYMGAADVMMDKIPEIEAVASHHELYPAPITLDGFKTLANGVCVDMGFLDMFVPEFIAGSKYIFEDHSNAIVSESFANRNGGPDGIIGKKMVVDGFEFTVAAVVEDFRNTVIPYCDFIVNIDSEITSGRRQWKYVCDTTPFIKIRKDADVDEAYSKIEAEVKRMVEEDIIYFPYNGSIILNYEELFFAECSTRMNTSDLRSLRIMLVVVILLLISAVINFINLNAALSGKRMKEVATRMVSGAGRKMMFGRYVLESIILCLICGVIAVIIGKAVEPYMNTLIKSDVPIKISLSPVAIVIYISICSIVGLIASLIPATVGTSVKPMDILKGKARQENKRIFSKIFISLQNMISVILIALSLTMELQMKHLAQKPVGAEIDDIYYLYVSDLRECESLKKSILELPFVKAVGISEGYPGNSTEMLKVTDNGYITYGMLRCDSTAFSMYNFKRVTDRGYPVLNSVWMTKDSFNTAGLDEQSPETGWNLPTVDENTAFGGIIEDYAVFSALKDTQNTIAYVEVFSTEGFKPFMSDGGGLLIKTTGNHIRNDEALMECYRRYIVAKEDIYTEPYEYGYIEDLLSDKLEDVRSNMHIMTLFMLLSVLLSFMGLVAMSTYYSSENIGDIAIRKVYGSTIRKETASSVWKYMKIVLISSLAAIPFAVVASNRYLEDFVYRIRNSWWIYVIATTIAILISLLAVFLQTLRAARTNPAEALKKE